MDTFEWTEQTALSPSNLNEMQDILNGNISEEIKNVNKIIWTNSNPTSAFSGQTINLNESLNNYDAYSIIFVKSSSGSQRYFNSGLIPVGYGTILGYLAGGVYFYRPISEIVSGSTITFEDGETVSTQTGTTTADNTRVIPLYVIGHNTGLFS